MYSVRRFAFLGLILFLITTGTICAEVRETNLWWTPDVVTKGGEKIDFLLHLIFWLTAVVFLVTQGVFIYFLIKYRRRRGVPAYYSHGNNSLEIVWTTIPAVIFIALAVYSNRLWNSELRHPAPEGSIPIDIVAYQYGWHIRNPGRDGKLGDFKPVVSPDNWFGLTDSTPGAQSSEAGKDDYQSENLLTVPVGKPVVIHLRSLDVIHAFYVPEFRMYQDVVPGRQIDWVWFEATKPGNFELACSQLCGSGHYNMKAKIAVVPMEDYQKLVAEKSKAALMELEKKKATSLPPDPTVPTVASSR